MDQLNEIVEEFRVQNYQRFDLFYDLTKRQVYFAVIQILKSNAKTEDILQDTYLKFLNHLPSYKKNTNPVAYLVTIARNLAINDYNKDKREGYFEYEPTDHTEPTDFPMLELLMTLPDSTKEVITLHIISNLKFKEIAEILHKPIGTVLWLYNKGIKELKKKVGVKE